ncbi:MAG TPA: bifunctional phosphoribosylaminoimidazolecarboxamide formyltransferase/IMP cyclohydrolase [Bryobacteraceae bacterium]|jgi:phosphoribosylaminoimidazolecarboxamide formyltransferase/IMP cyclohydrolase
MATIGCALLSVTDKTGLVDFARGLSALGISLISTGGTAAALKDAGLGCTEVSFVTGFPEMLDGRVKTLHPAIAGGILAIRSREDHMTAIASQGIGCIDLVVVNLYPFEQVAADPNATVEQLIENIDIGGPTMIRAAAKNYLDVAVVVNPSDYTTVLEELKKSNGTLSASTTWNLAKKAFSLTAAYDSAISARLAQIGAPDGGPTSDPEVPPAILDIHAKRASSLRYGENPHQSAALYASGPGIASARQLQGKELSYNNLVDLDAAWHLSLEFDTPASVIIKHTNPCGCAEASTLVESYKKAFEADPISAFGGVLAFNRPLDQSTAEEIVKSFVEAIAAPGYSTEALQILAAKKNLRLLEVASSASASELVVKSISGGYLAQTADHAKLDRSKAEVKTMRAPTDHEWAALEFGWKVAKHVKSNAIVYARAGQSVSTGAGQMSRVDSVKVGAMKAILPLHGTVLASDAFFPFPDGVEEAAKHGITAVIQPGGSVKDAEVIAAADRLGLAMVFTGVRHFRH